MNHLFRELAPVSDAGWAEITEEAGRVLREYLAARKLVDFAGPKGWDHSAEPDGRVEAIDGPRDGLQAGRRVVHPLVELRAGIVLDRAELDAVDRGATDADLDPVIDAARTLALAEDTAVFAGYAAGGITGISEATPHDHIRLSDDYEEYPASVSRAVSRLRLAGVEGPYGIALGPRCYQGVMEATQKGGYPVLEQVRAILGGPIVWAPAVNGAVVVSMRGGDFELVSGQDVSLGYSAHTADQVHLYLEESFTFRALTPEAGIALRYDD
ncbi:MAG TPA: family 1 encapsulin nanocompartment shell protein [Acidimicrobiales bacterium]|nr:family 1 encapsulin nanocompartment shell protein [Acidimicrobiales bacterium]